MIFQLEIRPTSNIIYKTFKDLLEKGLEIPFTTGIKDVDKIKEHYKLDINHRMISPNKSLGYFKHTNQGVLIYLTEEDARNSKLFETCSDTCMYISPEIFKSLFYEVYNKDDGEYGKPIEIQILFNENKFLGIWKDSKYKYNLE